MKTMRLSTSTGLMAIKTDKEYAPVSDSVKMLKEAGFDAIDCSLTALLKNKGEFSGEDWQSRAVFARETSDAVGIDFSQAHLPFPTPYMRQKSPYDLGSELHESFGPALERGIRVCSILGVKWAVIHPVQDATHGGYDYKRDIEYNHMVYGGAIELAEKLGVGIVFENLADIDEKRRYCSTAEELAELIDSYSSSNVRACWDFGHGNRTYKNQIQAIRHIGKRLKATHVDDNFGEVDFHFLPYLGNIDWTQIMKTLTEIEYDGDFTYEIRLNKRMPDSLKLAAARFAVRVGRHLISLA